MAVPKKKMSRSRTRRRKANWRIRAPRTSECAHCGAQKIGHRACPVCGVYREREVIVES